MQQVLGGFPGRNGGINNLNKIKLGQDLLTLFACLFSFIGKV